VREASRHTLLLAFCLTLQLPAAPSAVTQEVASENSGRSPVSKMAETDSLVLADFADSSHATPANTALRTALRSALDESPYLNLVSDAAVATALKAWPTGTNFTNSAGAICQRTAGRAYVTGSLTRGTGSAQMVIDLSTKDCATGLELAHEQMTSEAGTVIDTLGAAAVRLRADLGEPDASVERFNTPLPKATSQSLEALNAWSQGLQALHEKERLRQSHFSAAPYSWILPLRQRSTT
jgi:hypothetical protein